MDRKFLKTNSGGILLYAIITSMIISFVSVTLVSISFMRAKIMIQEVNKVKALNLLKGAYLYANHLIRNGERVPFTIPSWNGAEISVDDDPKNISIYKIVVKTEI